MSSVLTLLLCLLAISCEDKTTTRNGDIIGKVIGIKDGDTIDLLVQNKSLTVRLAHIDCPEKSQSFGKAAKQFISNKCFGQMVRIENENKFDRNGRLIGVVVNQKGENINKELVKAGLAWFYYKYSTDSDYRILEQDARIKHVGVWSEANPIPPWEFRRKPKKDFPSNTN